MPPESHTEHTDVLPAVAADAVPEPEQPGRRNRRGALVAAILFCLLAVVYVVDLIASSGDVPRGVTVAGVQIGGLSKPDAERKLRGEVEPRLARPVLVSADDVRAEIVPANTGLGIDWDATVELAGKQPFNPITRFTSLFSPRKVEAVTSTDVAKLGAAVESLRAKVDRAPQEGTVRFDGVTPVPVEPLPGRRLDVAAARATLVGRLVDGSAIELPVTTTPVKATSRDVREALEQFAAPAVAAPVIVHGDGEDATIEPDVIASALTFVPAVDGTLSPKVDQEKIIAAAGPQLESTVQEGHDAQFVFGSGKPTVQAAQEGVEIDWRSSLDDLNGMLARSGDRELTAKYTRTQPKLTADHVKELGITEVVGQFSTNGFSADASTNIKLVAKKVNGAIVMPGETFSLNGFTGPRGEQQGYVEAGVIKDGAPGRAVGGGVSQFATTLYNAAYLAGLTDAGHKEHSYHLSRYPAGRDATVELTGGANDIDLKFTNPSKTGVAIQATWTANSITVKIWGTKTVEVESVPGERTDPVPPPTLTRPEGEDCKPSEGSDGFTTSDTRIVRDLDGTELSRTVRTVHYLPEPKVVCG